MARQLLILEEISLTFGGAPVLSGADLTVHGNDRICLVGRNGSGKSTLLKIAAGSVEPDSGSRWVHPGTTVRYLPQEPDLSAYDTVLDYIEDGLDETASTHRLEDFLSHLHLSGEADPKTLSGGEARKAALARVLLAEPDILLLDEPTASLDPDTGDWVRRYLEEYRAETGATILLASHNMAEVERLCDDVLMMRAGRIDDRGSPADLLAKYGRQTMEDVFLDIARDRRATAAGAAS